MDRFASERSDVVNERSLRHGRFDGPTGDAVRSLALCARLDLEELWRLRRDLWTEAPSARLEVDFSRVRSVESDALLLLHEDLSLLARRGSRVRLRAVPLPIRRRLRWHPIARFLWDDEDVFTDPDLEAIGFRPSRH